MRIGWVWIGLLSGLLGVSAQAQQHANPFQLEEASLQDSLASDAADNPFVLEQPGEQSGNPFDLSAPATQQDVVGREDIDPRQEATPNRNFHFIYFSTLLVLLTILFSLFRSTIQNYYKAYWNDNILKLMHRQRPAWKLSSILWYLFFFLNLAVFLSQWIYYLQPEGYSLPMITWWLTLATTGLVLLKHLTISIIGGIFPLSKETGLYNFTIMVFGIILGLFLLPFNLLIAFGPAGLKPGIFYLAALLILAHLIFRSMRALFQTSRLWQRNKFHFFLYLCTVEIAPVIVLLKTVFW